jgi:NAD(P)-dependent dehydrogenase (short-subunit alcohol dehydrogenase family)
MKMIVVVTGASRGSGKGIAVALGAAGATVYVTGRSVAGADSPYGGTVAKTARLITEAGGRGIAVAVDHADDQAVGALFDRIKQEHGKLDILVNNAANLIATTTDGGSFWEKPLAVHARGLLQQLQDSAESVMPRGLFDFTTQSVRRSRSLRLQ